MNQWTALGITLAIEIPIVVAWVRLSDHEVEPRWLKLVAVAAAATLVTHPIVWYLNVVGLQPWPFAARAAVVETFAVFVEAVVFWRFLALQRRTALLMSLVANAASFGAGLLIWALR